MDKRSPILQFYDVDYENIRKDDFPADVLKALERINRLVAAQESLDAVMNFVFEVARHICDCDRMWLAFVEEEGQRAVAYWVRALYEPILLDKGYTLDIRRSFLKTVVSEQKVCVVHDLGKYLVEQRDVPSVELLVREGVRSTMSAPLLIEGRPIALLFRSSKKRHEFTDVHVRQHLATAERIGQAVAMAYRMDKLQQAIHSYLETLGFISHELKSPLSSMIMDGRLLAEGYLGDLNPAQRAKAGKIVSKAQYLLGLVREYLELARIESGEFEFRPHDNVDFVEDVVNPALELVMAQLEEKGMELTPLIRGKPLLVRVDRQLMRVVMVNLFSNAAKYGFRQGKIRLTAEKTSAELKVSVHNEGFGFAEKKRALLFKKFSRLESNSNRDAGATGVGLYTCWRIVRLHGGVISGESQLGQWARFSFRIPQPTQRAEGAGEGGAPASEV